MKFKYWIILIVVLGVSFLYFNINPTEVNFLPKCAFYTLTDYYCPGCGSQRATHQLLNFNFVGVAQQNLLYIIGLFILAYHLIVEGLNRFFSKNIYNYLYHPKTPIFILIIVVIFWVFRNIPMYPFNLLAPK